MSSVFPSPGQWYKGNLHTHTTESDGEASPQQVIDLYAERGYDFLSLTDHRRLTDTSDLDPRGLLLIPGSELNGGRAELGQDYHVVVLGLRESVTVTPEDSAQDVISAALAAGEVCWVAHPSWSSLTYSDLLQVEGHLGIEVYNTTCHHGIGRGLSSNQWDELLIRGQRLLGLAVDDAHLHYPDAIGGWIMAKLPELKPEAIYNALRSGAFYATTGPKLHDISVQDHVLHVQCSPVAEVRLVCPRPGHGNSSYRLGRPGPYTEVEFHLRPDLGVVRVEVWDERGRGAWSNPIWLD